MHSVGVGEQVDGIFERGEFVGAHHHCGPLLFAHLTGKPTIDDAFADRTIDIFLDAYGT